MDKNTLLTYFRQNMGALTLSPPKNKSERETTVKFAQGGDMARVRTCDPTMLTKLRHNVLEDPENWALVDLEFKENPWHPGTVKVLWVEFECPKGLVLLRKKVRR